MNDGTCEFCPKYTKVSEDGTACESDTCNEIQKLLDDGTCENCAAYTRASSDGK